MFKENKYSRCYYNIIARAKSRKMVGGDKHHILPTSLGGNNNKDNIVRVTFREHYLCHLLLVKMTHGVAYQKMLYAYTMMSGNKLYNSKKYHFFREEYSKLNKKLRTGKGNGMYGANRSGKNNTFYGKRHSKHSKLLISLKKTGVSIVMPPFTEEHKRNISKARKGTGAVYKFMHPIYGEHICNIQSLCDKFPETFDKSYHKSELWKLATGLYKTCKGWKIN